MDCPSGACCSSHSGSGEPQDNNNMYLLCTWTRGATPQGRVVGQAGLKSSKRVGLLAGGGFSHGPSRSIARGHIYMLGHNDSIIRYI